MLKGQLEFRVNRPPEEVFPIVADLERAPEWVPDLVSVTKSTNGDVGVGTRYDEVVNMAGKTAPAELEITDYEPNRLFAHKGKGGPATFTGRFTLEPDGTGTRVMHEYTVKLSGVYRMMAPAIGGWMKKNAEAAVASLKQLIDNG